MNPLTKTHTQGPTERRTLKIFLSRVSLILCLQLTLLSVGLGTDAGYLYHYCAAIDLGRSDPDCKRH